MMEDTFSDPGNYRIVVPGTVELNLGDEWRAKWVDDDALPEGAPVTYVYALVYRGDRGYVIRPRGSRETWSTVEGEPAGGESAAEFVTRAAQEQAGAVAGKVMLFGYLECRATSRNQTVPAGSLSVRAAYIVVASEMLDSAENTRFERRRVTLSEHGIALRTRYPELAGAFNRAAQNYAVLVARGEALT